MSRKRFYQKIDLRSRKKMIAFLQNHFRYNTMNSWNRSTSYACNIKIYNQGLDEATLDNLWELLESPTFFDNLNLIMEEFNEAHNYVWQVGMNGRSGGYLVLYQGGERPSEYKSYCSCCGQKNYRVVTENDNICGRCGKPARRNYDRVLVQPFVYPGKGTDEDEDFADWSMDELKERVKLIQEFDQLADDIVDQGIYMANNKEEYL